MNFYQKFAKIYNTEQSRSIIICGNVYDIFWNGTEYVPLIQYLCDKTKGTSLIHLIYELNGPIRMTEEAKTKLKAAWIKWKTGYDSNALFLRQLWPKYFGEDPIKLEKEFDDFILGSIGNPTLALEFLRQLTICSRKVLDEHLLIIVEAADMLLPAGNGDVASLNDRQLHRISIMSDWIGDPTFINSKDTLLLLAESKSLVHPRISKLPQVLSVEIPSPNAENRKQFLDYKNANSKVNETAGLSIFALQQLMKGSPELETKDVIDKVEEYIQSQLGEDVVEFKRPSHKLDDCVGFTNLKKFLKETLIPRMQLQGDGILPGAAVAGAIGGGKTYIFEAVAGELNMPVLVLKNIRSQWFGQTDVIFERLKRVLEALDKVLIFVDEADAQFGGIGENVHETERRLTSKIQAMMSDPKLKGKVYWLLMTARIHLLSPDIRRPGRVGDLIIPVLDPVGEDRKAFLKWALKDVFVKEKTQENEFNSTLMASDIDKILAQLPADYSAASFASLKNNVAYKKQFSSLDALIVEINDFIQPAISDARRYQTLQALTNCTRRSLLPDPNITEEGRKEWEKELIELEAKGIK